MRSLRKLVLGETWVVPLGVLVILVIAGLMHASAPRAWEAIGPVLLPAGVIVVLALGVWRSLPARR